MLNTNATCSLDDYANFYKFPTKSIRIDYNKYSDDYLSEDLVEYAVQDVKLMKQLHRVSMAPSSINSDYTIRLPDGQINTTKARID